MTPTTRLIELSNGLTIKVDEYSAPGDGTGALVLHGGAGPRSVAGLAAALWSTPTWSSPTHPGFDGTTRPDQTDTIEDLAVAYLDLIDGLDLGAVMVIGSSIGGWVAIEMSLRDNRRRITSLVLLGATGIKPEPPLEIADARQAGTGQDGRAGVLSPRTAPRPDDLERGTKGRYGGKPTLSKPFTPAPTTTQSCAGACTGSSSRSWCLRENRTGLSRPRTSVP